jgi:hypothetical protein
VLIPIERAPEDPSLLIKKHSRKEKELTALEQEELLKYEY